MSSQFCSDEFHLDLNGQRLLAGSRTIPLRGKTWNVFRYLAERPGHLVTKDELLDAVWPGAFVTDTVLRVCIREIRRALRDPYQDPRYIETVHGRGYRLLSSFPAVGEVARV